MEKWGEESSCANLKNHQISTYGKNIEKTSSDKHNTSEIISKPDSQEVVSQSILCNAQLSNIY